MAASLISAGALVGSLFSGKVMDAFGRKMTMLISTPILIASWFLIGFSPALALVYLGRILTGIAAGLLATTCPVSAFQCHRIR